MKSIKRIAFLTAALVALSAAANPKAIYVKSDNSVRKFNFGVAGKITFPDNGNKMTLEGYNTTVDLTNADYITFKAPIDATAMSPAQQKQKMIDVGREAFGMVNLDDNAELCRMIDTFFYEEYQEYHFPDEYLPEYLQDEEQPLIPGGYGAPVKAASKVLKAMRSMAHANAAAARRAQSAAIDVYKAADFYGVYVVDDNMYKWNKLADADYIEFRWPAGDGDYYKLQMSPSQNDVKWVTDDFEAYLPASALFSFIKGNTTLATITLNSAMDSNAKTIKLTLNAIANGYGVQSVTNITNYAITEHATASTPSGKLCTGDATVRGLNLLDYPVWKKEMDEATDSDDYWDEATNSWVWVEGNRDSVIAAHFLNATGSADLLGKVQVKGVVNKIAHCYEVLNQDEWIDWQDRDEVYDPVKGTLEYDYTYKDIVQQKADCLNDYADFWFYYDSKEPVQGYLTWDTYDDGWSYDSEGYYDKNDVYHNTPVTVIAHEWELEPHFTFPDLTSYSLDDDEYFNENNFSALVTDYEDLIDTFLKIVGRYHEDDEVDFDPNQSYGSR